MNTLRSFLAARAPTTLALLLCGAFVHADVTLEERVRVEGDGLMQMINMTTRTVTTISGDRARTDTDTQMDSRLMRMFGGAGPTAEIVRLDLEVVYTLDPKKRTYTESTFAEQRAEMERAMEQMREAQQTQQQSASGIDESSCEWSEARATSERTGETEQIAGFSAERRIVTATQSCTDHQTEQVCDFRLTLDQWLATDHGAAQEALDYYRAYAEKLGLDTAGSGDFAQRLESMYAGYAGIWGEIAPHVLATDGYPLRSSVALAIGGPQCHSVRQAEASTAMPGVGESIGGALGGTLGGMFGRRRDSQKTAEPAAEPAPDAPTDHMVRFLTINTELVSISDAVADPSVFEIPANYKPVR